MSYEKKCEVFLGSKQSWCDKHLSKGFVCLFVCLSVCPSGAFIESFPFLQTFVCQSRWFGSRNFHISPLFIFVFNDPSILLMNQPKQWMLYYASRSWCLKQWTTFYTSTFWPWKFSTLTLSIFDLSNFDFHFLLQWSFTTTTGSVNELNTLTQAGAGVIGCKREFHN